MTTLLIKLNGAPRDEVEELRQLLAGNSIDFYETDAGRWGISVAAIWLRDATQLEQARNLVDEYQQQRAQRARAEYEARRQAGDRETLLTRFLKEPVRFVLFLLLIATVIAFTLIPFLGVM